MAHDVLENGICVDCRPVDPAEPGDPHYLVDGLCEHCSDNEPMGEHEHALVMALTELDDHHAVRAAWDEAKHPRGPGGKFRSIVDRLKESIEKHHRGEGDGHPFDGYSREQLRRVARARGIELKRGEDRDSIAEKLLGHLNPPKKVEPRHRVKGSDRMPAVVSHYRNNPTGYEGRRRVVKDTPYDREMAQIATIQGFDGKPQVATRREMDDAVKSGWVEVWRGVNGDRGKSAADINRELRFGDFEPGRGVYGNGVYTSTRWQTAENYRGRDPKTNYPSGPGPDYGPEDYEGDIQPDSMLRIALDPDANFGDYEDLRLEMEAWRARRAGSLEAAPLADVGRYAAARGYDGMIIRYQHDGSFFPGFEGSDDDEYTGDIEMPSQYVVFNRTAMMIQRLEDSVERTA